MKRGGSDARVEAMRLLAEGYTLTAVAEAIGVERNTLYAWRDSPEGRTELAIARKAREDTFRDAAEGARRMIRENLDRAAQVLLDMLDHGDPVVRSLAARTLLDRGGVPRAQQVVSVSAPDGDPSRLTDDELAEYERVRRKLRGDG